MNETFPGIPPEAIKLAIEKVAACLRAGHTDLIVLAREGGPIKNIQERKRFVQEIAERRRLNHGTPVEETLADWNDLIAPLQARDRAQIDSPTEGGDFTVKVVSRDVYLRAFGLDDLGVLVSADLPQNYFWLVYGHGQVVPVRLPEDAGA